MEQFNKAKEAIDRATVEEFKKMLEKHRELYEPETVKEMVEDGTAKPVDKEKFDEIAELTEGVEIDIDRPLSGVNNE